MPRVSVIMPAYDQEAFLPAAVASLQAQTLTGWELLVVDDGSPGDVAAALGAALEDPRVRLLRLDRNAGLGAALNRGLDATRAELVAYLPCDDRYHAGHLASLAAALDAGPGAVLAVAGVRHGDEAQSAGRIEGEPPQLVQVMHRRTSDRWLERSELTTDDLDRMLWAALRERGGEVGTGEVSCCWTAHPAQRHRVVREPVGGLNPYRGRYQVREPLRFHSTRGALVDEVAQYAAERARPDTPPSEDGLRILLVGDLSHNADRVLALEERGHALHGLWTDTPHWYNTVGPLPFGHVAEVPRGDWRAAVRELSPDVIYGLLNWQSIGFAHEVLDADLGFPFVWHFKEGPADARVHGLWPRLVELLVRSDGQIYSSPEQRDWFAASVPATRAGHAMVLDGDLARASRVREARSPLLSDAVGGIHTVITGRPLGIEPELVRALADEDIHLHLYGEKVHVQWGEWVEAVRRLAPDHLSLHPQVDRADWVAELSHYDAGWLHPLPSANGGDLHAATWHDLNYPARIGTLAACGVPMIQRDSGASINATERLLRSRDLGVLYRDAADLARRLGDRERMAELRESVWRRRDAFTFDAHADELIEFLRAAIARAAERGLRAGSRG